MKLSGPGLLSVGRFLIIDSVSLLVIGLFIFSTSSGFSLGRLCVSRNLFLLGGSVCWCIIVHSSILGSLVFL